MKLWVVWIVSFEMIIRFVEIALNDSSITFWYFLRNDSWEPYSSDLSRIQTWWIALPSTSLLKVRNIARLLVVDLFSSENRMQEKYRSSKKVLKEIDWNLFFKTIIFFHPWLKNEVQMNWRTPHPLACIWVWAIRVYYFDYISRMVVTVMSGPDLNETIKRSFERIFKWTFPIK